MDIKEKSIDSHYVHYCNSGATLGVVSIEDRDDESTVNYHVELKTRSYGDLDSSITFSVTKKDLKEISEMFSRVVEKLK